MRFLPTILICAFVSSPTLADDNSNDKYVMNFDLITKTANGEDKYKINLKGIHLPDGKVLHADDLREFEYFLTVVGVDDRRGKLTIEFYEYETQAKASDVISEIVSEVDFEFGKPSVFQSENGRFGIDLAFSIALLAQ